MPQFEMTVNGHPRTVQADGKMPLLWVLRDRLGLNGTRFGCGLGQCGACTVLVDGEAVRSCSLPVEEADGSAITTIEGLSSDGTHPLQLAWVKGQVAQCGYCQSGMIMAAAALLARTPTPTPEDIRGAIGNLCRCGSYARVEAAILETARAEGGL